MLKDNDHRKNKLSKLWPSSMISSKPESEHHGEMSLANDDSDAINQWGQDLYTILGPARQETSAAAEQATIAVMRRLASEQFNLCDHKSRFPRRTLGFVFSVAAAVLLLSTVSLVFNETFWIFPDLGNNGEASEVPDHVLVSYSGVSASKVSYANLSTAISGAPGRATVTLDVPQGSTAVVAADHLSKPMRIAVAQGALRIVGKGQSTDLPKPE
jgi:hypothetical protein